MAKLIRDKKERIFDILNIVFMFLFCITIIYPFWDVIRLSIEDNGAIKSIGFRLWNSKNTLEAYDYLIFHDGLILRAYANTLFRTVVGTGLSLIVTLAGAYSLSKRNLPGRNALTFFYLVTMFFSGGLIPSYILIRSVGLYDSIWVYIVPGLLSVYNMIIMRNFLMAMDAGIEESALIEGAGYVRILFSIIVPLSTPVIATIALWNAVGHWNAWFDSMIYTKGTRLIVLQMLIRRATEALDSVGSAIYSFNDEKLAELERENVQAATIILTIGPIVLTYPFLQKYFVKGIMIGSLKG